MNRVTLLLVPAVLVFANFAPSASAQTGPTGPVANPASKAANPGKQQAGRSAEKLAEFLRSEGYEVKILDVANSTNKVVVATVARDGWRFVLEFEHLGALMNVICPLGDSNTKYSAEQLLGLMKANYSLSVPLHFSYRDADKRLLLEDPLHLTNVPEEYLRNLVTRITKAARETYPLWGAQNVAAAGNAQPAPNAAPVPAAPKPAQNGIINTTWVGNETLGGYGRLELRFLANGKAVMVDNDGSHEGTFTIQNNSVTLRFYNGTVVYNGTINGSTMNGSAANGEATWSFSVNR